MIELIRNIAQPGSAPVLGTGGRGFESLYSDQSTLVSAIRARSSTG